MSADYHKLAEGYMADADVARRDQDPVGEAAYCVLAAHCEQQAIDALRASGLERPRTLEILERSRDALNERANKVFDART